MLEPPYYFNIVFAISILHVMDINKHGGPAFREMDIMRHWAYFLCVESYF